MLLEEGLTAACAKRPQCVKLTIPMQSCFRINSPSVIYERFDDELVAINLNTGVYHSLTGVAADVFELLAEEATADEISEALARKYAATVSEIVEAVVPFLQQLQKEELIAVVEARKPRGSLSLRGNESEVPFAPPCLEAYRDLQSLFLLDPIHEVGERGWPQPASASPEA